MCLYRKKKTPGSSIPVASAAIRPDTYLSLIIRNFSIAIHKIILSKIGVMVEGNIFAVKQAGMGICRL